MYNFLYVILVDCHVLNDGTFIHNLFRFLQLLCEGHNESKLPLRLMVTIIDDVV